LTLISGDAQGARRIRELCCCLVTLVSILASFAAEKWWGSHLLALALILPAYVAGAWYGMKDALVALRDARLDVNLLMIVAAAGAALVDQWHEGATLLFLFSLSNTLQQYAMARSRKAIQQLMRLRPNEATVLRDGREERLPVDELVGGDLLLLRPGELIAADGIVRGGESDVNEASITGESTPVDKGPGDVVYAGALVGSGSLEVQVTRRASESTLARIVHMVESAQMQKSRIQRFLDDVEGYYAKVVLLGVALFILVPWLFLGHDFALTFYRAMVLLVVASPCALVISTPASMLSAIAAGARNGILFKGGVHLENLADVKVAAFDKTGTLTEGRLQVTDLVLGRSLPEGFDDAALLAHAAALESRSGHPIAKAILAKAQQSGITVPPCSTFLNLPGRGANAVLEGFLVWIGGARMYQEHGERIPPFLEGEKRRLEREGKTVLILHRELGREGGIGEHEEEGGWLGLVAVADTVRAGVPAIVAALKRQGIVRAIMLTGDNEHVAANALAVTQLDEFHANLLPEEKVDLLHRFRRDYGPVMMIGDGVNDAPALAHASVGIAMGAAGTDVALESADIVLMGDDLDKIPFALQLSRQACRTVRWNVAFSLAVIAFLVAAVFLFGLPLPMGVLGHEGSTLLVVMNGLRLLALRDRGASEVALAA